MYSYFGDKMKYYRKLKKMTLDDLAEKIGSSKQVLSRYERGERVPKISAAHAIAEALDVDLADMVDVTEMYAANVSTKDEARLISLFSQMTVEGQRALLAVAESFAANPAYKKRPCLYWIKKPPPVKGDRTQAEAVPEEHRIYYIIFSIIIIKRRIVWFTQIIILLYAFINVLFVELSDFIFLKIIKVCT